MPDYTPPSAAEVDTDSVTTSGALMDSEITNLAQVKAFDESDYATAAQGAKADSAQQPPTEGAFANGDKDKLDGIATQATAYSDADALAAIRAADPLILLDLDVRGGLTTEGSVLSLSTMETTVVANDVLGRINFQAPLEASGGSATSPGASIHALATNTFAGDNNDTAIVLSTAAAGGFGGGTVLHERMRITPDGKVGIGTTAPSEMLHLSDSDASEPTLLLENTGTSTSEPNLMFRRSGSHPSDPTVDIGRIAFEGDNTNNENILYAAITGDAHVATDGDERGRMRFHVMRAGAITEILRIGGYEISINEGGGDVNFRVEGASDSNLLVVDAGSDRVGIGTSSPAATLDVQGSARFRASVEVCTSDPAPANIETGTIYQFTKGSAGVFTLPADPPVGTQFVLVNGDGEDIVITRPHSSVKINGATSNATNTTAYAATSIVAVVSNGNNSEWLAFGGI